MLILFQRNQQYRTSFLVKVFIIAIFLSEASSPTAERPTEVEKKSALDKCKNNEDFPDSVYFVNDTANGHWCCECLQGYFVKEDCKNRFPVTTQCSPCPSGYYSSKANHNKSCEKFHSCEHLPNTILVSGDSTENNKCICIDGTYALDPSISGCKRHNQCPKGFGVKTFGNSSHDSTCELCLEGMCSDDESSTQQCSKCVNGTIETNATTPPMQYTNSIEVVETTESASRAEMTAIDCSGLRVAVVILSILLALCAVMISILIGLWCCGKIQWAPRSKKETPKAKDPVRRSESAKPLLPRGKEGIEMGPLDSNDVRIKVERSASESSSQDHNERAVHRAEDLPPASPRNYESESKQKTSAFNDNDAEKFKGSELKVDIGKVEQPSEGLNEAVPDSSKDKDPKSSDTNLTEEDIRKIYEKEGYGTSFFPDRNSDCLYAAISHLMNQNSRDEAQENARQLRRDIVEYMKKDFSKKSEIRDLNAYLDKMSKDGYGDHYVLQAACELFNLGFKIVQTSKKVVYMPKEDRLLLGHVNDGGNSQYYVCLQQSQCGDSTQNVLVSDRRVENHVPSSPSDQPPSPVQKRQMTENEYTQFFSSRGYDIVFDPAKDGHCQFAAIACLRFPDKTPNEWQALALEIRRELVDFMDTHQELFQDFQEFQNKQRRWNEYIGDMSKSAYGDNCTLAAAYKKYKIPFKIVQTSGTPLLVPGEGESSQKRSLLGHIDEDSGMHYVCLSPCSDEVSFAKSVRSSVCSEPDAYQPNTTKSSNRQPTSEVKQPRLENPTSQMESEHSGDSPTPPDSGINAGTRPQSSVDPANQLGGILDVFHHANDRKNLSKFSSEVVKKALQSEKLRREMLQGPLGLQSHVNTSDLKHFIRQNYLLSDVLIDDTERENEKYQGELRAKLLIEVARNGGKGLTPQKLLKIASKHKPQHIYDTLCKAFIDNINVAAED